MNQPQLQSGFSETEPTGVGLVLDVLSAQLDDTAKQVEDSVTKVCMSFTSIARRTKANAARATLAADSSGSDGNALETARLTISGLLRRMDRVQRAADESVETLRRIEAISQRVDKIQASLDDVDQVSHALKILALNAKIEAARAGKNGNAFGVVATETGVLAARIRETAKSVRGMVDGLWEEVKASTRRMRVELVQDQSAGEMGRVAEQSREEGTRALDALTRAHVLMQGQVAEAASNSEKLAEDIEEAMTALQFQDAVNQQIEHVVSALHEAREVLESGDESQAENLVDKLRLRATMQSERLLLARITNGTTGTSGELEDSAPSSVELF